MLYQESDPAPGASPWIANHWRFVVEAHDPDHFEHVIVPDGTLSISLALPATGGAGPVVFAGPSTAAHRVMVHRGLSYVGVRLHPAACGPLLRLDAAALCGKIGMLEPIAPEAARILNLALRSAGRSEEAIKAALESAIHQLTVGAGAPDPAVVRAVDALLRAHGAVPVTRLAADAGLSVRQLRRKFQTHVGLSPKAFARIRRLRHACIRMLSGEDARLAGVSLDGGYADQSHLAREFRGSFGSSLRLVEAYLRQIEHVAVKD